LGRRGKERAWTMGMRERKSERAGGEGRRNVQEREEEGMGMRENKSEIAGGERKSDREGGEGKKEWAGEERERGKGVGGERKRNKG
jgi:hypothetical protein